MINLRQVMIQTDLSCASFPESRVINLLDDLKKMYGVIEPIIEPAQITTLKEDFRRYLKEQKVDSTTIKNKVSRLNRLIQLAVQQGLLPRHEGIPLPPRPKRDGPERRRYNGLRAFNDWCRERTISLGNITRDTFITYRDELRAKAGTWSEDRYNCAVKGWRELVAQGVVHELDLPRWNDESRDEYGLPRGKWPTGVAADFTRFCRAATGQAQPGEKRRRLLRQESLADIERELCRLLGYVSNILGRRIQEFGMTDLLEQEDAVIGFISWHINERCGGSERKHHAESLNWFARLLEWSDGDKEIAQKYRLIASSLKPERARDPFPERPITYEEFTTASLRALEQAERDWKALVSTKQRTQKAISAAIAYRDAILFAFLICRPMRSRNMREMKLGPNVYQGGGVWRLRFSEEEMKASEYSCAFPEVLAHYLNFYLAEVRPFLASGGGVKAVFLTKSGKPIGRSDFWKIMTKAGGRIMGLKTNPHLFRYLIPSAYLLRFPDRALEMQALLGHSVLETTLRYYVHVYSRVASQRAAEVLRQNCPSMVELGLLFPPSAQP